MNPRGQEAMTAMNLYEQFLSQVAVASVLSRAGNHTSEIKGPAMLAQAAVIPLANLQLSNGKQRAGQTGANISIYLTNTVKHWPNHKTVSRLVMPSHIDNCTIIMKAWPSSGRQRIKPQNANDTVLNSIVHLAPYLAYLRTQGTARDVPIRIAQVGTSLE